MIKKDAYYFSHDSNAQDDPKCMMLIDDLGMEGYGIFWALIEKLRAEKDYTLPVSICGRFARRWATSEAKIQTVVNNYGLFEMHDDKFFSLRLKRSMEEKSQKARLSAEVRWGKNQQLTIGNVCERNAVEYECIATEMLGDAIKVKESKIKEKETQPSQAKAKRKKHEYSEEFETFFANWKKAGGGGNKIRSYEYWEALTAEDILEIRKTAPSYFKSCRELNRKTKDLEGWINPSNRIWESVLPTSTRGDNRENVELLTTAKMYS
jgi:hypothetical protein